MSAFKRLYFLVLFMAALWAVIVVCVSLFSAEKIFFIPTQPNLPDAAFAERGEVLRLSFFLLFAYYTFLHVFAETKRISSGHALISILTILTFVGSVKLLTLKNFSSEAGYILIFGLSAFLIFLGSRPSVRRYFKRR